MNSIVWPEGFIPGTTDNFVSNEIILANSGAADVWPYLKDTSAWATYYSNVSDILLYEGSGSTLGANTRFRFTTFGFPVEAEIVEYIPPTADSPGRIAWHGWVEAEKTEARLDVHHAWLLEDLAGNRVRILTQETQNGGPAKDLAKTVPNPMLNAHQDWIDGLGQTAVQNKRRN